MYNADNKNAEYLNTSQFAQTTRSLIVHRSRRLPGFPECPEHMYPP